MGKGFHFPENVVVTRGKRGVDMNLQRTVTHHSPEGWECGYSGSGPADLALQIVESYLLSTGYRGPKVKCWEGKCFKLAFKLHQDFKAQFIAPMDENGGSIPMTTIKTWVKLRRAELKAEGNDDSDDE